MDGSTPNIAYVDGASSREMDVDPSVVNSNTGLGSDTPTSGFDWNEAPAENKTGKKKKVTVVEPGATLVASGSAVAASVPVAAAPATLATSNSTTIVDLSSVPSTKGADAMDPPLKLADEQPTKMPKYSKKTILWFSLGAVLAVAIGTGLGVGLGLYLPSGQSRDTNSTELIATTSTFSELPTPTTQTLVPTDMVPTETAVPPLPTSLTECSNYSFIDGSAFTKPPSTMRNRLEQAEVGRPMMGFSIEWGEDLPTALTARLRGRSPSIVGGFAHLINATYWEQNIIDWYAWQIAMGSVPNYNTSNPSTNYTGAANPPAIMLLALMPAFDLNQLTDATADGIAAQCARINDRWGIPIMMRFGHEMNGNWNAYSQRPLSYVATFRKLTLAIRRRTNLTAMVWAPNFGSGYPYNSPNRFTPAPFSAEWNATDTNRDGKFDGKDDPYTPYWPGADYVDWVGMSAYWLSYSWPMGTNQVTPPDYLESIVNGTNYEALQHSQPPWDIYEMFCKRYNKPFILPESGAAFYLNFTNHRNQTTGVVETHVPAPGPGELRLKQTWWRQVWDRAALRRWPLLKAIVNFEESKLDERGNVSYLLTFNNTIRNAFLSDVNASGIRPIWANSVRGYDCAGRIELRD